MIFECWSVNLKLSADVKPSLLLIRLMFASPSNIAGPHHFQEMTILPLIDKPHDTEGSIAMFGSTIRSPTRH
jgi:hypothetical protein